MEVSLAKESAVGLSVPANLLGPEGKAREVAPQLLDGRCAQPFVRIEPSQPGRHAVNAQGPTRQRIGPGLVPTHRVPPLDVVKTAYPLQECRLNL